MNTYENLVNKDFNEWLRNWYAFKKVDYWIDKYRDYLILYAMFQDESYLIKAKAVPTEMNLFFEKKLKVDELIIT